MSGCELQGGEEKLLPAGAFGHSWALEAKSPHSTLVMNLSLTLSLMCSSHVISSPLGRHGDLSSAQGTAPSVFLSFLPSTLILVMIAWSSITATKCQKGDAQSWSVGF